MTFADEGEPKRKPWGRVFLVALVLCGGLLLWSQRHRPLTTAIFGATQSQQASGAVLAAGPTEQVPAAAQAEQVPVAAAPAEQVPVAAAPAEQVPEPEPAEQVPAAVATEQELQKECAAVAAGALPPPPDQHIPANEASFYRPWIQQDLSIWNETGITQQMVDHAFALGSLCDWRVLRIQIVNGTLWAHPNAEPPPEGYDPMAWGEGWVSAKGRPPNVLLGIMEALHFFPGQIPDVDFVFQLGDYPCITELGSIWDGRSLTPPWIKDPGDKQKAAEQAAAAGFTTEAQAAAAASPPIFSFNSRRGYRDIPFPDHTWWGHEMRILKDGEGRWLYGWDAQLNFTLNKYANLSLANRWPQLIWRGRYYDPRDALRKMFVDCGKYLGDKEGLDAGVLNLWENWGFPAIDLENICHWRYMGYLESHAYSSNFKQKMACGSVLVTPVLEYYEFFSRALRPAVHYLELSAKAGDMCEDIHRNVKAMNGWLDKQAEQEEGSKAAAAPAPAPAPAEEESGSSTAPAANAARNMQGKGKGKGEGSQAAPAPAAQRRELREGPTGQVGSDPYKRWQQQQWQKKQQGRRRLDEGIYGSPTPKAKERYSNPWDSDLTPLEVANNGRQFVVDHLRMRDVRLYIRDLLQHYAKLQRFKPTPQPGFKRYTGLKLLDDIAKQYKSDGYQIAAQYPWIPYFGLCRI